MKSTFAALIGAALLAGALAVHAQAPAPGAQPEGKGPGRAQHRMRDCAKAPDPKACEERREKARRAMKDAHQACEGKQGPARSDCMRQQLCAQAKDPAQCEARAKERAERRRAAIEACKDRKGQDWHHCMREQRRAQRT
jgi:hypothetical protein